MKSSLVMLVAGALVSLPDWAQSTAKTTSRGGIWILYLATPV
ncbi:MAG: hypothetical protein ACSLEM_03590 [Candidatus Malihini olakiniferum]